MRSMFMALSVYTVMALSSVMPSHAADTPSDKNAEEMAQRLIEAMGGREVWAKASFVHTWAVNYHPQARLPYTQEYWSDLNQPRTLNRLRNFDLDRLRGVNIETGWGISEGRVYDYDAQRIADEREGWGNTIYAKLVAIARRDPKLHYQWKEGRLIFLKAGVRAGWIELNAQGEPTRFASAEGAPIIQFEALEVFGPIKWPRSGVDENGWRFEILSIELGTGALPVSFNLPKDIDNLDPL